MKLSMNTESPNPEPKTVVLPAKRSFFHFSRPASGESNPSAPHKLDPKRLAKAIALLLLILLIVVPVGYLVYNKVTNKVANVGGTKITTKQVKSYSSEIASYAAKNNEDFGGTPQQVAQDDLILNAALKDQAKKHNITVSQADIDASLSDKYSHYGGKAGYQQFLKTAGIATLVNVRDENAAYEDKLQSVLINTKQLFYVGIYYDSPYFNNSKDPAALRAQAVQEMQSKFLPLFQQGQTKEQIAQQTQFNTLVDSSTGSSNNSQAFFTGMPTVASYVPTYNAVDPVFNDDQGDSSIKGIVGANQASSQLTKVGQTTGVITTKAGFIGIIRLEGSTGGPYNSWDDLLKDYKTKYAQGLTFDVRLHQAISNHIHGIASSFAALYHVSYMQVFPNASAVTCSQHQVVFKWKAFDDVTNARMGGIKITEERDRAHISYCQSIGTASMTTNKTDGWGDMSGIQDNCYGPGPDKWTKTGPPSGYKYEKATEENGLAISHGGYPTWSDASGQFNGETFHIDLWYLPTTWSLTAASRVKVNSGSYYSNVNAYPGDTVTFHHSAKNANDAETASFKYVVYKSTDGGAHYSAGSTVSRTLDNNTSFSTYNVYHITSAMVGEKICEYMHIDPGSKGGPAINTTKACAPILPIGVPGGTASCSATSPPTITGTNFKDPDDTSKQLSYAIYVDQYSGTPVSTGTTSGTNHGFTFNAGPYVSGPPRTFIVLVKGVNSSGSQDGNNQPPFSVTCNGSQTACSGGISPTPAIVEPGAQFAADFTVDKGTASPPSGSYIRITSISSPITGLSTGQKTTTFAAPNYTYSTPTNSLVAPGSAQIITVTWNLYDPGGNQQYSSDCTGDISIVTLPYFNAYGSGVIAGGQFSSLSGGSCQSDDTTGKDNGVLASWYHNDTNGTYGASSQLSAIALLKITGFASGQLASPPLTKAPAGLTFANTANVGGTDDFSPALGGDFTGTTNTGAHCLNEQNPAGSGSHSTATTNPVSAGSLATGVNTYSGASDLYLKGGTIHGNVSLFVDGGANNVNVYVGDDGNNITTGTTWGTASVPSFVLQVTGGNIYIDSRVTQLDGLYIARPDSNGNGGKIYTCGDVTSHQQMSASQIYSSCSNQLTVYGTFAAAQINLMRTFGTLKDAQNNTNCTNRGSTAASRIHTDCAAEVFDFSPEMYLSNPAVQAPGNGTQQWDAITTLPPVL